MHYRRAIEEVIVAEGTGNKVLKGCGAAIGCLAAVLVAAGLSILVALWLVGGAINSHEVALSFDEDVGLTFSNGRFRRPYGEPRMVGTPEAAQLLERILEEEAVPRKNGLVVLYQQLWYNAITEYDLKIWFEKPGDFGRHALYHSGHTAVLRQVSGPEIVLWLPYTPTELEDLLAPHVVEASE